MKNNKKTRMMLIIVGSILILGFAYLCNPSDVQDEQQIEETPLFGDILTPQDSLFVSLRDSVIKEFGMGYDFDTEFSVPNIGAYKNSITIITEKRQLYNISKGMYKDKNRDEYFYCHGPREPVKINSLEEMEIFLAPMWELYKTEKNAFTTKN